MENVCLDFSFQCGVILCTSNLSLNLNSYAYDRNDNIGIDFFKCGTGTQNPIKSLININPLYDYFPTVLNASSFSPFKQ